ncbi:hypothetical protein OBBRIDRAFT_787157 [Obba rivulosa]|uniref:Uncharacterized protein n=1 Tax=Obba rivulosa TaxID=1052685 RepID=A0A8E2DVE8_9APHY|nr:hypothetical protein OBBRIDRAFT_787157 [Obba rivulosa]
MRLFHRKEAPWEVVDTKSVEPVAMFDEDEDLDVLRVADADITVAYTVDLGRVQEAPGLRGALEGARLQVLKRAAFAHYNILLHEGWRLTLLRRGKKHRVEVRYTGRAAYVAGKLPALPPPPFVALLDLCRSRAIADMKLEGIEMSTLRSEC